jgi:hypothetical protein
VEDDMANITFDAGWIETTRRTGALDRITHRLRVFARLHRINRFTRARIRLARAETHDTRVLADMGISAGKHRHYDWVGSMARGLGGNI